MMIRIVAGKLLLEIPAGFVLRLGRPCPIKVAQVPAKSKNSGRCGRVSEARRRSFLDENSWLDSPSGPHGVSSVFSLCGLGVGSCYVMFR